jgi:hypothetical protein
VVVVFVLCVTTRGRVMDGIMGVFSIGIVVVLFHLRGLGGGSGVRIIGKLPVCCLCSEAPYL